ncbi:UTP--glucose-1-phosphate uridylyltransferase GalU [Marininema halotolerans]|uniref:UTP--glucose-1-phosphate uridylyltransferase n=1 Tax=Marininema halotolerans TaxID=1155944 RepID=A0A1I6SIY8_9BACL|nr:UTP--glucose-1-phosphate uridylyltransferase GalU [Marininema halotolerans]SFS76718.1 UTP--glucose-1-phosphate uridylyltransferase [Marininema halotolerans]
MRVRKAIIPAAGLGTRFLPATKAQPKEMLPIVDKPAIQYIVEEAIQAGIESIMIVTGRNKQAIENHFDKSVELESLLEARGKEQLLEQVRQVGDLADIHYIRQKEPLGLGHAILCARQFIEGEPFAVLLGDDIIDSNRPGLRQMMDVYEREQTSIIGVQPVPYEETRKYGVIAPAVQPISLNGSACPIRELVEKPAPEEAPSNLAIIGRYILEPEIFGLLQAASPGVGGEIQLTDSLQALNQQKSMIAALIDGERYDVGDRLGYIRATIEMALRRKDLTEEVQNVILTIHERIHENRYHKQEGAG